MSQKFHNGGRTYRTGKGETDAELSARLAAAREREALHGYAQLRADDTGCAYFVTGAGQALLSVPENRRAADEILGGIVAVYKPHKIVR